MKLNGKAVLVTGTSGGIGMALAKECASRGARLALCSRDLKAIPQVPNSRSYKLDVTKPSQLKAVCKKAERDFGGIDILINNAGAHLFAEVEKLPEAMLKKVLDTNLFGPLRMIQALLPAMKKRGSGLIVNIGSNLAWRSIPRGGGYSASKAALARLTESLRDELAGTGVKVLHAAPGVVLTRLRDRAAHVGAKPEGQSKLPFPREAGVTAKEIVDAIEAGKREVITAAWPVKFWAKVLVPWFPKLVDHQFIKP